MIAGFDFNQLFAGVKGRNSIASNPSVLILKSLLLKGLCRLKERVARARGAHPYHGQST